MRRQACNFEMGIERARVFVSLRFAARWLVIRDGGGLSTDAWIDVLRICVYKYSPSWRESRE